MAGMERSDRFHRWYFLSVVIVLLASATGMAAGTGETSSLGYPKNIIILLADGVTSTQLEVAHKAARYLRNQPSTITDAIFARGTVGFMTTDAHGAVVTDSAAAGTAMSTGSKTSLGTIGMTPDGRVVRTAMEVAKARGKRIGLVTTAAVCDATPAAFSVHARTRWDLQGVVDQYLGLAPDVILGGGSNYFLPTGVSGGKRKDGRDMIAAFQGQGYQVARDVQQLRAAIGPRLLGLFAPEDMAYEIDRNNWREPSIVDMAEAAIRLLSKESPKGFVLLLETENTDTAGHHNDLVALILDLWAFDRAVQVALEFQRRAPSETLIIVTGDHETGGLALTYALQDVGSPSSQDGFYAGPVYLEMIRRMTRSIQRASETLGTRPSAEAVGKLVGERFPGFRLAADLRQAAPQRQSLPRTLQFPLQSALGSMISAPTGFSWGTSSHTAQPAVVGALGPGAELFNGYLDNTDFGRILHLLIEGQ